MHTGSLSGPLETWQRAERLDVTRGAVSLVAAAPPACWPAGQIPGQCSGSRERALVFPGVAS